MPRFLLFFLIVISGAASGQDLPVYSLYMFNGLVLNPAYVGSQATTSAVLNYRSQWSGFEDNPQTITATFDTPLANEKYNLGAIFSYDQYGLTRRTSYKQCFAYRLPLGEVSSLAFGAQAGLANLRFDLSELENPDDPAFVNNYNKWQPLAGLGMFFQSKYGFVGVSNPYIALPEKNIFKGLLPNQYEMVYLNTGVNVNLATNLQLFPSLLYKYQKQYPAQIDINGMLRYKKIISGGISYRANTAVVLLADFTYKQFKVGYAYDHYMNGLKSYSKGAHEIMVKYDFKYIINVIDPKTFH